MANAKLTNCHCLHIFVFCSHRGAMSSCIISEKSKGAQFLTHFTECARYRRSRCIRHTGCKCIGRTCLFSGAFIEATSDALVQVRVNLRRVVVWYDKQSWRVLNNVAPHRKQQSQQSQKLLIPHWQQSSKESSRCWQPRRISSFPEQELKPHFLETDLMHTRLCFSAWSLHKGL